MRFRLFLLYCSTALFFLRLQAEEAPGFFTEVAALYWKAEVNGLSYAIESPSPANLSSSSVKNPSFDWDFGFKAGIGYRIKHDAWEFLLRFTSLQTHTDSHNDHEVLHPGWLLPNTSITPVAGAAKMHWRLHLGVLDFLLRNPLHPGTSLQLRPAIGIRSAWIRQKFNLEYRGGSLEPDREAMIRTKNKFFGIGPTCGLYAQWDIKGGFALFSEAAFSVLFGEFYLHQDEDLFHNKEKVLGIHNIYHQSASILDGTLGAMWQRYFQGTLKCVDVSLSWNQSIYFTQNQLMRFVSQNALGDIVANQGDLAVSGIQLSARLDF